MDASDYERAGLYDPAGENADDRLALLEWLSERGLTLEQMLDAKQRGTLTELAGDRALRPGPRITLRDAAERASLDVESAQRAWQALGFPEVDPDALIFTDADVNAFAAFASARELFGEYGLLYFTRVIGSSLARIAEGAVAGFLVNVEAPLTETAAGELARAQTNLLALESAAAVPEVMDTVFRHHLERAIRVFRAARTEARVFDTARFAVGFVDLVGYTSASTRLNSRELATMLVEFESRAFDTAIANDGRVVKFIGDEVMFVSVEPEAACAIALTLCERLGEQAGVTPRGGLAHGEVLTRAGDYYGSVVNRASRIADLAVPDEILVTTDVRDEVVNADARGLAFEPAGRRMLKGFDDPVELYSLSRA